VHAFIIYILVGTRIHEILSATINRFRERSRRTPACTVRSQRTRTSNSSTENYSPSKTRSSEVKCENFSPASDSHVPIVAKGSRSRLCYHAASTHGRFVKQYATSSVVRSLISN